MNGLLVVFFGYDPDYDAEDGYWESFERRDSWIEGSGSGLVF